MGVLIFILGLTVGFLAACWAFTKKLAGTIKFACDGIDNTPYLFLELSEMNPTQISAHGYVLFKVDPNVVYSHE